MLSPTEITNIQTFIKNLLVKQGHSPSDMEMAGIEGLLKKLSYQQMYDTGLGYATDTFKNHLPKIFPLITKAIQQFDCGRGLKVNKRNFFSTITKCYKEYEQNQQSIPLDNLFHFNNVKIKIFDSFKEEIMTLNSQQQNQLIQKLKLYFKMINKEELGRIESASLAEIIDIISEQEDIIIDLLQSLAKDRDFEQKVINLFQKTLQKIKQELNMNNENLSNLTINQTPVKPLIEKEMKESQLEHYLMILIKTSSDASDNNSVFYIDKAYLAKSIDHHPQRWKIDRLNFLVNKEYVSKSELIDSLTQLIEECKRRIANRDFILECFVDNNFLSLDFENWEYVDAITETETEKCQDSLKSKYLVQVRSLSRLKLDQIAKKEWEDKWQRLLSGLNSTTGCQTKAREQQAFEDPERIIRLPETVWINLCHANLNNLERLFIQILRYKIPVALWSRCQQKQHEHCQEINDIVSLCNGNVEELPRQIHRRRLDTPSKLEIEPDNLGHHLSLLWEHPYRLPPNEQDNLIQSQDFGQ